MVCTPLLVSVFFQNRRQGSGLIGQGKGPPPRSTDDEHGQTPESGRGDDFDELPSTQDLESMSPGSKSRYWSLSDIRAAVSNIRTQILPGNFFNF